jgi:hypothetical protein
VTSSICQALTRYVMKSTLNPRFLSYRVTYDVTSDKFLALPSMVAVYRKMHAHQGLTPVHFSAFDVSCMGYVGLFLSLSVTITAQVVLRSV